MKITSTQKKQIIQRIYDHIKVENNGYCRVGWAITEVMGDNFKPENDKVLKLHLANMAIKPNKYIKDRSEKDYYDFDISENPNYTWASANPLFFNIITSIITILLSVIASLLSVNYF